MMTSVTLSTGIILSGYGGTVAENMPAQATSTNNFEQPRPVKRSQSTPTSSGETSKKRRKQSTPVRISAVEGTPAFAPSTSPTPASVASIATPSTSHQTEGKISTSTPTESDQELRCSFCQFTCSEQEQLENHVTLEHVNVNLIDCKREPVESQQSNEGLEEQLEALPSARHDLPWMTNDLQNKDWISAAGLLPFNPANQMFMSLPFSQPEALPSRQQIRIFNPDAYCELCNKEFCNKYFLKTHKANKHGIYTDPPTTEMPNTSVNIPSYLTTQNPKPQTTQPTLDLKNQKPNKLHIYPDAAPNDLPNNYPTPNIDSITIKTEPKPTLSSPFPDLFPNPFNPKLFPKTNQTPPFFDNPSENFPNPDSSELEKEKQKPDDQPEEASSSPKNIRCDFNIFKNEPTFDQESQFYSSSSKMSPIQQQQRDQDLSNRLRKIGVMNPKAFCEICCKEYCNKYFLRTHKMKRHGIFIPDDSKDKDHKSEQGSGSPWIHNTQTSPLNLIMAEQNNSSSSFGDRKTSSPPEISCDQCGIKFQNSSLAQLHAVSVHAKLPPTNNENLDNENQEAEKKIEGFDKPSIPPASTDSISEDLQKLQTMILQLNDLNVNKPIPSCHLCNREFENRYYLHSHMMTEHGLSPDELQEGSGGNTESETAINNNNTICEICGKDFHGVDEMKRHIAEFHSSKERTGEGREDFSGFVTPEKSISRVPPPPGQQGERRSMMNMTPTSSYCEICNKELCNKYFMKTHMQRMHGIEIENGAQIGGVVCDICNKELCSKYFLRVHKHNTHGIVEYGSSLLQPRKNEEQVTQQQQAQASSDTDPSLKPIDLADLSHRYFQHFTEVCAICSRRFRSTKWLKAHLLSDHGQAGAEKWAELEQQLQQYPKQAKTPLADIRISPTLKIPNGGGGSLENSHQSPTSKVRLQNVLSSIFGSDEANTKTYHCSYCPFSTTLLPFLFVHERSHSLQSGDGELKPYKCPACPQSFLQGELLQHHVLSQHPFLGGPFYNGALEEQSEFVDDGEDGRSSTDTNKQSPQSKVKKIKRKPDMQLSPEMGQSLRDTAKRAQLPATYALPQTDDDSGNANGGGGYTMQAFLVDDAAEERRFAPSVVYLPVLQRQSAPLSVTFNLTPA